MKKMFELKPDQFIVWSNLMARALEITDHIELNILFEDQALEAFLKALNNYKFLPEDRPKNKFYNREKSIQMPVATLKEHTRTELLQFARWQTHYIEDPSCWKDGAEILACISHENLVMIEMDHFADLVEDLTLYDLKP